MGEPSKDGAEWVRFLHESGGGGWVYSPGMLQDEGAKLLRTLLPYSHPGETPSDTLERLLGLDRLGGPQ
jgi:hypothetical protein